MMPRATVAALPLFLSLTVVAAAAADQVSGTFTVNGRTTTFKQVYVTQQADAERAAKTYLVIVLSDVPIAASDRSVSGLTALARAGKAHAVRIVWSVGFDTLYATPYDQVLAESGRRGAETPTIDIQALDDGHLEANVHSKMLGQAWHFNARLKADIARGGAVEIEPPLAEAAGSASAARTAEQEPKRRLGSLGYDYKPAAFANAVKDGNPEAVRLFLSLGMSANTKDEMGTHPLIAATSLCRHGDSQARTEIITLLLRARADVNATDSNKSTPLIWAAQSCDAAAIKALIDAGADVNAKAAGGGTALMLADALHRNDIANLLRRAGAKQ